MGMPLLQSATSVLRQTWGFDLVPLRHLVVHWVDTILIVISRVGLSARLRLLLFGHPLARVAELLHHFCGTPLVSWAPELSCSASPQEKEKRPAWAGRGYLPAPNSALFIRLREHGAGQAQHRLAVARLPQNFAGELLHASTGLLGR